MCRMVGAVTRTPARVTEVLGESLAPFVELSREHQDGWGLAWYDQAGAIQTTKAPEAAHASSTFARDVGRIQSDALICHLRWASVGLNQCIENTHPFTFGAMAFAHNGSIAPVSAVEGLVAPQLRPALAGTTDSERYFLALVSALETATPIEALRGVLAKLHASVVATCLNCLLLTPDALYAVCDYDPRAPKTRQDPDYYRLLYRVSPDTVMVGSSGWQDGDGWIALNNGEALAVDRGTLRTTVVNLASDWPASLMVSRQRALQR